MTTTQAANETSPDVPPMRARHVRPWTVPRALAFFATLGLVLSLATVIYAGPVVTHCNSTIYGEPGDATAGGVWTAWHYERANVGPWPSESTYTSAPYGESAWRPLSLSSVSVQVPVWLLSHVLSPVCSWNVGVFSGFVIAGMAMGALTLWLTSDALVATFGAIAFAFLPSRFLRAGAHIDYVHTELIPLLLLAILFLCARPSWRRAILVGATVALLGYTDGYYILIGLVLLGTALLVVAVQARRPDALARARFRGLVLAAIIAFVLMLPLAGVLVGGNDGVSDALTHTEEELSVYGARPYEYLLPARDHPVFDDVFGRWQDNHLHGSNYFESTIYLGWVALFLAGAAILLTIRRKDERSERIRGTLDRGFVVRLLGAIGLAALLFSLGSATTILGIHFPAPADVVFAFVTFWRAYVRFSIVVQAVVVALAGVGLARLLRGRTTPVRTLAVVGLLAVVLFELLVMPPRVTWSYEQAPSAFGWLATQRDINTIAEYPLYSPTEEPDGKYFTYQPVHEKHMINARLSTSDWDDVDAGIAGLGDPNTLPVLRRMGVDAVVVHPSLYGASADEPVPEGLELIRSFTYDEDAHRLGYSTRDYERWSRFAPYHDVDIYRVTAGPKADLAMGLSSGFSAAEPNGWNSFRWVQGEGTIEVRRLAGDAARARVSFLAASALDEVRLVEITQDDKVVWSGPVRGATPVEFTADVGTPLSIRPTPDARTNSDVDRSSTDAGEVVIGLSNIHVEPLDASTESPTR